MPCASSPPHALRPYPIPEHRRPLSSPNPHAKPHPLFRKTGVQDNALALLLFIATGATPATNPLVQKVAAFVAEGPARNRSARVAFAHQARGLARTAAQGGALRAPRRRHAAFCPRAIPAAPSAPAEVHLPCTPSSNNTRPLSSPSHPTPPLHPLQVRPPLRLCHRL